MRPAIIISISILFLLYSCETSTKVKQAVYTIKTEVDSVKDFDSIQKTKTTQQESISKQTIPQEIVPVFGYRFVISGDFDGDGKNEKLTEHFYSQLDNKETNKFYEGLTDYDQLVDLTVKKDPVSFISSDNKHIDTLLISSGGQLLGLSYLKNEGDLNGDGTDEVSYVVDWAD